MSFVVMNVIRSDECVAENTSAVHHRDRLPFQARNIQNDDAKQNIWSFTVVSPLLNKTAIILTTHDDDDVNDNDDDNDDEDDDEGDDVGGVAGNHDDDDL